LSEGDKSEQNQPEGYKKYFFEKGDHGLMLLEMPNQNSGRQKKLGERPAPGATLKTNVAPSAKPKILSEGP
jgi:hypothetical protein